MKARFDAQSLSFASGAARSRCRNLRFEPPNNLTCSLKETSGRFALRDISVGGLSLLSTVALREGEVIEMTLTLDDLRLQKFVRVVHCRDEGEGYWIAGLAFLNENREGPSVEDLLDRIAPGPRSS